MRGISRDQKQRNQNRNIKPENSKNMGKENSTLAQILRIAIGPLEKGDIKNDRSNSKK